MLEVAKLHENKINELLTKNAFTEKTKYLNTTQYADYELKIDSDSWNQLAFASVHKNNVIGYLSAKISRTANIISNLYVINFYDLNYTFSKDFHQFLTDLLIKYNFEKVNFCVVVGNPIEGMYDKYVYKYGGRIVGVFKNDAKLYDNKYYDVKWYEIMRNDYLEVLRKNKIHKVSKNWMMNFIKHSIC